MWWSRSRGRHRGVRETSARASLEVRAKANLRHVNAATVGADKGVLRWRNGLQQRHTSSGVLLGHMGVGQPEAGEDIGTEAAPELGLHDKVVIAAQVLKESAVRLLACEGALPSLTSCLGRIGACGAKQSHRQWHRDVGCGGRGRLLHNLRTELG